MTLHCTPRKCGVDKDQSILTSTNKPKTLKIPSTHIPARWPALPKPSFVGWDRGFLLELLESFIWSGGGGGQIETSAEMKTHKDTTGWSALVVQFWCKVNPDFSFFLQQSGPCNTSLLMFFKSLTNSLADMHHILSAFRRLGASLGPLQINVLWLLSQTHCKVPISESFSYTIFIFFPSTRHSSYLRGKLIHNRENWNKLQVSLYPFRPPYCVLKVGFSEKQTLRWRFACILFTGEWSKGYQLQATEGRKVR